MKTSNGNGSSNREAFGRSDDEGPPQRPTLGRHLYAYLDRGRHRRRLPLIADACLRARAMKFVAAGFRLASRYARVIGACRPGASSSRQYTTLSVWKPRIDAGTTETPMPAATRLI